MRQEAKEGSNSTSFINKKEKKLNHVPDVLMLLKYTVELDGSLLQFKHKVSLVWNNNLPNPPTGKGERR